MSSGRYSIKLPARKIRPLAFTTQHQNTVRHAGAAQDVSAAEPTSSEERLFNRTNKNTPPTHTDIKPEEARRWFNSKLLEYNAADAPQFLNINMRGSAQRIQTASYMKYYLTYNTMDTIVVVFKLYDGLLRRETNFGMLFCEIHNLMPEVLRDTVPACCVSNNVAFRYFSSSASYVSCDGEYRSQFSEVGNICTVYQQYNSIFEDMKEYVQQARPKRTWSVYTSYFYPKLEQEMRNTEIEFSVRDLMFPSIILTISWFLTVYEEYLGITKTHINPVYKEIMMQNIEQDIQYLKQLISKYGADQVERVRHTLYYNAANAPIARNVAFGFKMMPLNIKEVQEPLIMRHKQPWREFFITQRCSDMVINGCCPSFPLTNDWFYIKNSRKGLYDNVSQYDRMHNSELAKDILHTLYEAQRGTYFITENLSTVEKTDAQIKKYISQKFKKLHDKIEDPVNYALEDIIMSEVTLAYTSEYVGRTFADSLNMINSSALYDKQLGHCLKEQGYDYWVKYMFEICYALFCCNTKLGVIHGDLHLNNATIGPIYSVDPHILQVDAHVAANNKTTNTAANTANVYCVVYHIDGQLFIFPNNGVFSQLIDFSRALINPSMADAIVDRSLPPNYKIVEHEEKFRAIEIANLLNIYIQMFPSKLKHREELIVIFKNHYDAAFRLLCCIDIYLFSIKLQRAMRDRQNIHKRAIELVGDIHRRAEQFIVGQMNQLIENPAQFSQTILKQPWPMLQIITGCFADYACAAVDATGATRLLKKRKIIDYYSYAAQLKYSITAYDYFHPLMKEVANSDTDHIHASEKRRQQYREVYERQKIKNLSMMDYISMRHKQKLA